MNVALCTLFRVECHTIAEQLPDPREQLMLGLRIQRRRGSPRITSGASRKNVRASATRCHCPVDRSVPSINVGPSSVSYPSGNPVISRSPPTSVLHGQEPT